MINQPQRGCRVCMQPIYHDIRCRLAKGLDSPVLDTERVEAESQQGEVPPEIIWTQMYHDARRPIAAYDHDPREVHDNGKPVYKYRRVKTCRWKRYEGALSATWYTGCQRKYAFRQIRSTPITNRLRFCPYCAGTITVEETP